MERRQHQRDSVQRRVTVHINDRQISCMIANISAGGALLSLDPHQGTALTQNDTGQEITIVISSDGGPGETRRGRIIRHQSGTHGTYIAVFFI